MPELRVARSELVLGAAGSGKHARAQALVSAWLGQAPAHRAARDDRVEVAHALGPYGRADTLVVADCLTFWLTASSMASLGAVPQELAAATGDAAAVRAALAHAVAACRGPLVLVSNEPAPDESDGGRDARAMLDSLVGLNQAAAAACERVTLMAGGRALLLKGQP